MNSRIYSLDYLRGLMAISVMVFHYSSWAGVNVDSGTVLGRLGIYAVSMFYILSGLSLTHVYKDRIKDRKDIVKFIVKRVARIIPLFWLATVAVLLISTGKQILSSGNITFDYLQVFLNFSLLFGFISPSDYIVTGGWSIGNEFVFYVFFPLFLIILTKNRVYFVLALLFILLLALFYHITFINSKSLLTDNWDAYINPINQVPFFIAGCLIGYFETLLKQAPKLFWLAVGWVAVLLFFYYPVTGDKINLVVGINKYIFLTLLSLLTISILLTVDKFKWGFHIIFKFFGDACYSIYLLHPIVSVMMLFLFKEVLGKTLVFAISSIVTLMVSYLTFNYIEKGGMELGKKNI